MAYTILAIVGQENRDAVIATTITSYALSSILTGLVFFLMGLFNFGYIVGFIPRHILLGCIGGVGWFLVATGLEVSARLEGNLNYNLATLYTLFGLDTLFHWAIPLALATFYGLVKAKVTSKYFLAFFMLAVPAVFYFYVFALDSLDLDNLRKTGWIFEGPESGEKWWHFYTLYSESTFARALTIAYDNRIPSGTLGRNLGYCPSNVGVDIFWGPPRPN
jgi:SulP family sulfate permease